MTLSRRNLPLNALRAFEATARHCGRYASWSSAWAWNCLTAPTTGSP
jgi:hypothetical protein